MVEKLSCSGLDSLQELSRSLPLLPVVAMPRLLAAARVNCEISSAKASEMMVNIGMVLMIFGLPEQQVKMFSG